MGTEEVLTAYPIGTIVAEEEAPGHLVHVRITAALHAAAYGIGRLRGNGLQCLSYKQPSKSSQYVPHHRHQHPDGDECS